INREAERCKRIVQNLQTFARKRTPQKEPVCLNEILESTLELRSYPIRVDNIKVERHLDPHLPRIKADFHQLQQVFLNILINAHQEMVASKKPGRLIVRSLRCGTMARVEIEDNGPGIAADHMGKLFDPFFTTKEVGQGTGLGLSICYGIIEEHKGHIKARNSESGGAIFTVDLPIDDQSAVAASAPARESREFPGEIRPRDILVVDDELAILDILYQVLKADGHRVDTALNGAVALRKIRSHRYDLIISDLKMPGMSGKELYERICSSDEQLARRMIFSTGDVVSVETSTFLQQSGNRYVQKPFDIHAIRRLIHSVAAETVS
ncbi:MAG: ATP-binding protein, partial [Acidobacteriota bacterium]